MELCIKTCMSVTVAMLLALLVEVPGVISRPRDKRNGLYDEWKPVPFVDSHEESTNKYGEFDKDLGNSDATNKLNDKYLKLYEKYNSEHHRTVGDDNSDYNTNITTVENNPVESSLDITPVEGGVKDVSERVDDNTDRKKRKRTRDRENKKNRRHHKSVKKDLSEKEKKEKELKRQKRKQERKNKKKTGQIEDDMDQVNIEEFYREHPNFQKNVATITDISKDKEVIQTNHSYATSENADVQANKNQGIDSQSEDDLDQKDADDFDEDDDFDDYREVNGTESKSMDESSEAFDEYYDYYDEDGDSSYSSSEQRAEQEMLNNVPSDWFKQYDRMYGDQPAQSETQSRKMSGDVAFLDDSPDLSLRKTLPEEVGMESKETIPKTDVEPSTSPNPPTQKKDVKSTVTQPSNPLWKERVETWNLIESKPVESCRENAECPSGRMCKFGLCLCGQPDFCQGHYKPVCGSDGRLYPSHCELHRTACVLGVHISPDMEMKCQPKVDGVSLVDAVFQTADNDHSKTTGSENLVDTSLVTVTEKGIEESPDKHAESQADSKVESALKTAFDKLKSEEVTTESNAVENPEDKSHSTSVEVDLSKTIGIALIGKPELSIEGSRIDNDNDTAKQPSTDTNLSDPKNFIKTSEGSKKETEVNSSSDSDVNRDISTENSNDSDALKSYGYDSDIEDDYEDDYDDVSVTENSSESTDVVDQTKPDLVPLFCTPDVYMKFKADVLEYHCIFFQELHCDRMTQEEKQKLAVVMFNYYDQDFSGHIEKEELWEQELLEHMDDISTLCTLLDIVTFDELGERDGKLSVDEFIQAFDIPDMVEHKEEVVPLLATVGNGLEVKCDITDSSDIVWKRNGIDLGLLAFPGISVLGDGSLYLETVGFHMVGNLTCYDRQKPSLKQIQRLTVQEPPRVYISLKSHDHLHGSNFDIKCHAEGYPKPTVTWQFEGQTIQQGARYHIQNSDYMLTIQSADYQTDTGTYTCHARNTAGEAVGSVLVTVHNPNTTDHTEFVEVEESFIIFHDNGYTLHEPSECLTQRHVKPDFGNFYFIPDELDAPPALCEKGIPCVWGSAVNVRDTFVYATQPRENRVIVVDVADTFNPNQVIFTDHVPVGLHYVAHLDEVWVLCWNGEGDTGSKTVVVIRNASQRTQHHAIHTQPIGNRFDQVQDIFLPPDSELHHPYMYGYTVHNGQQGLFKVSLQDKRYTKAVDFSKYNCVPRSLSFIPLGGHVLVECERKLAFGSVTSVLTLDYITDVVTDNITMSAKLYVSPDVSIVAMVDDSSGKIAVHQITENGEIIHQYDLAVGSSVDRATFHKARFNHGYDLYLTSTQAQVLYAVSLENGKVDMVKDLGEPDSQMFLPWLKQHPLVSGDIFSDYIGTTAKSSMLIVNGQHHDIQCNYRGLENPAVIAYSHLRT